MSKDKISACNCDVKITRRRLRLILKVLSPVPVGWPGHLVSVTHFPRSVCLDIICARHSSKPVLTDSSFAYNSVFLSASPTFIMP